MAKSIYSIMPDPEALLALEPEELAGVRAPRGCTRDEGIGPSGPVYRNRFQTASSCMGKEPLW